MQRRVVRPESICSSHKNHVKFLYFCTFSVIKHKVKTCIFFCLANRATTSCTTYTAKVPTHNVTLFKCPEQRFQLRVCQGHYPRTRSSKKRGNSCIELFIWFQNCFVKRITSILDKLVEVSRSRMYTHRVLLTLSMKLILATQVIVLNADIFFMPMRLRVIVVLLIS